MTDIDLNHPVIVSAVAVDNRSANGEPIAMMVSAATEALTRVGHVLDTAIDAVHVVKGIWPYVDPGRLIIDRLPSEVSLNNPTTAISRMGGNAPYDLVSHTAAAIAAGDLRAAIVCGAETMRTRRADKAAGRRSPYLAEADEVTAPPKIGEDVPLSDEVDAAARIDHPVYFYAMAEHRMRHRRREAADDHRQRIAALWAEGSTIASANPNAWIQEPVSAEHIATPSERNRMVTTPYTKLLTSNINVDQGGAILMSSYSRAKAAGIADGDMVFVSAGASAHDQPTIRMRERLDESPALRAMGRAALSSAAQTLTDIDHVDLYSCFPAAVQLARKELGLPDDKPFTMTGGMTFAGGPFNGYGTQAAIAAAEQLRGTTETALLTGNGGYFTKHSAIILTGAAPRAPFAFTQPQAEVDAEPTRPLAEAGEISPTATVETYTVPFDRHGNPEPTIVSVLDARGRRFWALAPDAPDIERFLSDTDLIGASVTLKVAETADDQLVTGNNRTVTAKLTSN